MITDTLANDLSEPTGEIKALLQFNKTTGAYIGALGYVDPNTLNKDLFVYVTVQAFNFTEDTVTGTYGDFKIVKKSSLPTTIYEKSINTATRTAIATKYPVIKQINILSKSILAIAEATGTDVSDLKAMLDDITAMREEANLLKLQHLNDTTVNYVSSDQQTQDENDRMSGLGTVDATLDEQIFS